MSKPVCLPLFDTREQQQEHPSSHPYPKDYQLAADFIHSYRKSHATFNAYRREIERLLQWSAHIARKPLAQLKRQDMEHYIAFCQSPPDDWIALQKYPRYCKKNGERIANPQWRPFVVSQSKTAHRDGKQLKTKDYYLSQKAIQAIFAILSSFYNFLIQENYLEHNPVSQIRQKNQLVRKSQHQAPIRRLSELQWAYVIETADLMAGQDRQHERTRFIMHALYGMYLRISELAASDNWQPTMNNFFRDQDGHWWFQTVGKGNKERRIVVCDAMLEALKRYRNSLGLPPLPDANDNQPLIRKNRGKGAITSTRQIRIIVQDCFDQAYQRMLADKLDDDAEQLKTATVHWLRHTGISDDIKHRPREHVRDDAGHRSSTTTDRYVNVELRERHASGKRKVIQPDE